jgi:hypothetical protein
MKGKSGRYSDKNETLQAEKEAKNESRLLIRNYGR